MVRLAPAYAYRRTELQANQSFTLRESFGAERGEGRRRRSRRSTTGWNALIMDSFPGGNDLLRGHAARASRCGLVSLRLCNVGWRSN